MMTEEEREYVAELRGRAAVADSVMAQIRAVTAERATWEVQAIEIKRKWETLLQAAKNELRAAQKGLTSGCGCPIGVCLKMSNPGHVDQKAACWMEWALLRATVFAGQQAIDTMKADSMHPSRFAHANQKQ